MNYETGAIAVERNHEAQLRDKLDSLRAKFGARRTKAMLTIAFLGLSFVPEIRRGEISIAKKVPVVGAVVKGFYETFLESEESRKVRSDQEWKESQEKRLEKEMSKWDAEEEKLSTEELEAELRTFIPGWALDNMKKLSNSAEAEPKVAVSGFESIGIANEDIEQLIETTLPLTVSHKIEYTNIEDTKSDIYGVDVENSKVRFETLAETLVNEKTMTFFKPAGMESVRDLVKTISHEEQHVGGDFTTNTHLTYKTRLFMAKKLKDARELPYRTNFEYVDNINRNRKLAPEVANWKRLEEYVAELFGKAFKDGPQTLNSEERRIVEVITRKTNPEFDFESAKVRREKLIEKIDHDKTNYATTHRSIN